MISKQSLTIVGHSWVLTLLVTFWGGCSGGGLDKWEKQRPAVVRVTGTVTHNGVPLKDAVILMHAKTGKHSPYGRSDSSGQFVLTTFKTGDGAVPGGYDISVVKIRKDYEADSENPEIGGPIYHAEQSLIPDKYMNPATSGLTAVVPENGKYHLDIELTGPEGNLQVIVPRKKR